MERNGLAALATLLSFSTLALSTTPAHAAGSALTLIRRARVGRRQQDPPPQATHPRYSIMPQVLAFWTITSSSPADNSCCCRTSSTTVPRRSSEARCRRLNERAERDPPSASP